jgi:hypothetical protein
MLYAPAIARVFTSGANAIEVTETAVVDGEFSASSPAEARERKLVRLATGLTVTPLVVSALYLLLIVGGDYYPSGDVALTELHTRDVGRHMLWLGPGSRDGWYHPGPALFYVLVLPYRLLGSSGAALSAGALLINGTSVLGMAVVARRRGGAALALSTLVACSLLLRALGPEFLSLPWNAYITVLPYGLLLFLTWTMVCGDRWALPLAVFVTCFLVETHIGYVVLAVPLLGLGTAWLVASAVTDRRGDGPGPGRLRQLVRPGLLAGAIGTVMWIPPVLEQFQDGEGNLGRVVHWFREGSDQARTLPEGWRVVAAQYAVPPEWLVGEGPINSVAEPTYVYERVIPVLLVPVLIATSLLWRRQRWAARSLVGTWAVASVMGVVATARTIGLLYAYRLHWAWVLGMVGGVLVLWAIWMVAKEHGGETLARVLTRATVVVVAVLAAVNAVTAVRADVPTYESRWLDDLAPSLRDELDDLPQREGDVVIVPTSFGSMAYVHGLVLDLERHGLPGRVTAAGLGDHRVHVPGTPLRAVVDVVTDRDIPAFLERRDRVLVAYVGTVPKEQLIADVAELERLSQEVTAGLRSFEDYERRSQDLVPAFSAAAIFLELDGPTTPAAKNGADSDRTTWPVVQ